MGLFGHDDEQNQAQQDQQPMQQPQGDAGAGLPPQGDQPGVGGAGDEQIPPAPVDNPEQPQEGQGGEENRPPAA